MVGIELGFMVSMPRLMRASSVAFAMNSAELKVTGTGAIWLGVVLYMC